MRTALDYELAVLSLALCARVLAQPAGETYLEGPAIREDLEVVAEIDDFGADSAGAWRLSYGRNISAEFRCGVELPDLRSPVLSLAANSLGDDKAGEANWIRLDTDVKPDASWTQADGIRVVLGSRERVERYVDLGLVTPDGTFTAVLQPYGPYARTFTDRLLAFSDFRGPEGKELAPASATGLCVVFSGGGSTAHLDSIQLYRSLPAPTGWLEVTTNKPRIGVFSLGETVELIASWHGDIPQGRTGIRWEVQDYRGHTVDEGTLVFPLDGEVRIPSPLRQPGYYEVRAFLVDEGGRSADRSCIRMTGSVPLGISSFAIMPRTLAQNHAVMTEGSFFGLHLDTHGLGELMGCTWHLSGWLWEYVEPDGRPARTNGGLAPWAQKVADAEQPRTGYDHAILNHNPMSIAKWARSEGRQPPGWTDWADFQAFLRDEVRLQKHLYPHLTPRIYEPTWEIDLRMAPALLGPADFTPADVVELYRRSRAVIKAEDPDAIILGANASDGLDKIDWLASLLDAGLADQIDAISIHGYHGEPPPEVHDLPAKIARLKATIREKTGRDMPIYCLEFGYKSIRGSVHAYRETAAYLLRADLIFQGEGLRLSMPFYGYDYAAEPFGYGMCFTLDPTQNWGPERLAPKPHVPALATQAAVLNHATPVRRIPLADADLWGYAFRKDGKAIAVLWAVGEPVTIQVPAAAGDGSVERTDMMGVTTVLQADGGRLAVTLDEAPQYLAGVDETWACGE